LRILRERYCKRLPPELWRCAQRQPDKEFAWYFEHVQDFQPVAHAYLDFADINHDNPPRDAFHGPRLLRKQLGRQGLSFPLYDFALLLYWIKGRGESRASAKTLFPSEEAEFIDKLLNCVYESKTVERVSAVLKLFDAHFGEHFGLYLKKRKLEKAEWQRLESLDPNAQLYFELPKLFALDLNAALSSRSHAPRGNAAVARRATDPQRGSTGFPRGAWEPENKPPRIVLFFDTHEAFWGVGRVHESTASYFLADEWLRRLLRALDLDKGIVAVVAGREPPRWADAPINPQDGKPTALPLSHLDTQLIGHLDPEDADEYLEKAGVADAGLRQALVRQAEVAPGQAHPLYAGLCGDIALIAARQGQPLDPASFAEDLQACRSGLQPATDPAKALIERLLRYCHADLANAVKALAAARAFDRELFFALGEKLHYHATEASYQNLMGFSFVWPSKKGEGWGRIHDLLRRVLWEIDEEQMAKADAALEDWFRARHAEGDDTAIVEAIYHANRREWYRGYVEWNEVFGAALQNSRYALCASLLELRPELWLETDFAQGLLAYHAGEFALALSRYETARFHLQDAVACYDGVLQHNPDDVEAHNNRGLALWKLADLLAGLAEHKEARDAYRLAIAAYDEALRRAPDFVLAHMNRGSALLGLADLLARLTGHAAAWELYGLAIAAYDEALRRAPDYVEAHNNRGNALLGLAGLLAGLAEYSAAQNIYGFAIAAYDEVLRRAPDFVPAHNNRGNILLELGNLLVGLAKYEAAQDAYRQAIAAYDETLRRAPDFIAAHNNRGEALRGLANLLARLAEHKAAQDAYEQAIAAYDEALRHTPDLVPAHSNRGNALRGLADLLAGLAEHEAARDTYRQAITAYDEALCLAPNFAQAHNNRGITLDQWAKLLVEVGDLPAAQQKNTQAGEACRRALGLARNDPLVLWAIAQTQMLAARLETLTQGGAAPYLLRSALHNIEEGLAIAPGHPQLLTLQDALRQALDQQGGD